MSKFVALLAVLALAPTSAVAKERTCVRGYVFAGVRDIPSLDVEAGDWKPTDDARLRRASVEITLGTASRQARPRRDGSFCLCLPAAAGPIGITASSATRYGLAFDDVRQLLPEPGHLLVFRLPPPTAAECARPPDGTARDAAAGID